MAEKKRRRSMTAGEYRVYKALSGHLLNARLAGDLPAGSRLLPVTGSHVQAELLNPHTDELEVITVFADEGLGFDFTGRELCRLLRRVETNAAQTEFSNTISRVAEATPAP